MKESKISNNYDLNYENYKDLIKETLKTPINLKYIEFKDELEDLFSFEKYEFLLFRHFSKLIILNIDLNCIDNEKIINYINKTRINNENNIFYNNIFRIILHMQIYFLEKIGNNKLSQLNQINNILMQNFIFICKLYKEKLVHIKKIILYFNILLYFLNNNKKNGDKNTKIKIIIITELLIEKYFGCFLSLLFDINKEDEIILFLEYVIEILNSNEFKSGFNYQIIAKTKIIENFMRIILDSFNYDVNNNIYNKYKERLISIFANIYRNNIDKFHFFESLIKQNKKSFINLVNYTTKKEFILKDIQIQNFYIKLLDKIFSNEKNIINDKNIEENYFLFNGYNSKMTINLNEFSLNNSLIFFSFQLSKDALNQTENKFPLIIFLTQNEIRIIFKLYIQKENDKYILNIYLEIGDNKKKTLTLEKVGNIQLDINYIVSLKFLNRKICVYIIKLNEKNEKYFEEFDFFDVNDNTPILKIGNDEDNKEYFKGYIGTLIVMKNLVVKKNCKIDNFINKILELKKLYIYFPFFLSDSSIYNLEEKLIFSSNKEENEFNEIKTFLVNNIEKYKFEIYLYPKMVGIYYSLFFKNKNGENYYLTEVPNITKSPKYKIIDMDISLVIRNKIYIVFLMNNGFDYLNLIFEYYYNFFKLLESEPTEFDFYLNNNEYKNIINKSIQFVILIINKYYTYYKYIILNIKKYKTLFRNLHEILKFKNNGIFPSIFSDLFGLHIELNNEVEILRNQINNTIHDNNLIEYKKTLFNFSRGLFDIFFNYEIYLNSQNKDILNLLFLHVKSILDNYNNNFTPEKLFLFEEGFFFKLLSFIKILEKEFKNDYKNKNKIISSYFDLIKNYLDSIDKKEMKINYFKKLFKYVLINFENNLNVIINFLYFVYENQFDKYYFESEEIKDLEIFDKKLEKELENKENGNNNLLKDFNLIIFLFLISFSFISNSNEIVEYRNSKLEKLNINENTIPIIIIELKKNFEYFLDNNKNREKYIYNLKIDEMKLFENIFDFILYLFKEIIKNNENQFTNEEKNNHHDIIVNKGYLNLLNFLADLNNILKEDINKKRNNINCIYSLINFLIFFYKIINFESKILLYSDIELIKILLQVIDLCKSYYIINCEHFFKFNILNEEYQKTIIEIIYELSIQLFLNDENTVECYDKLLESYNFIFYDRKFLDNTKKSIFYVNDYLGFLIDSTKLKPKEIDLKNTIDILKQYNEFFNNYKKFSGNMVTYFLNIIIESKERINMKKNFCCAPASRLSQFLDNLFLLMLEEHSNLYNLNNKYFFHKLSPFYSTELINYIKENYVKKKLSSIEQIKEKIKLFYKKCNIDKNKIVDNNRNEISNELKRKEKPKQNQKEKKQKSEEIQYPDNKIHFFYNLDKYYITNIKKEIMNCIFSLYYLDEFFYSNDFCIIKKYYTNFYLNDLNNVSTKKLNFPSIIKNYSNNFEPPVFVKKFNNYMVDPYFPITHSYIKKETLNKKLTMEKSIKLYPKELNPGENINEIECELIKNDKAFYGKLFYCFKDNYLLFKEQENTFINEEGFKHLFLLSNLDINDKFKNEKYKKFFQKKSFKSVLIFLDEIEEIIEMRILLLRKGFEIYLKNGKSYLFNFLTTKDYNNFVKNFENHNILKYLFRRKNFWLDKDKISKKWSKSLLSNFDYLLILNRYSSRSYNDPTQYPIFPWLLNDYKKLFTFYKEEKSLIKIFDEFIKIKEKNKNLDEAQNTSNSRKPSESFEKNQLEMQNEKCLEIIIDEINKIKEKNNIFVYYDKLKKAVKKIEEEMRNFKYPPSSQNEKNIICSKSRYEEDENNAVKFPIHSGCHYSNVGYIYYYLERQQPYGNLFVKMQGYNLENTNRHFLSLTSTQSIINQGDDNRELIPDFFCKIENLLNLNCDLFGYLECNNKIVDDYIIEDIENNNNYNNKETSYLSKYVSLIIQHKKLLNSKLTSLNLNHWIDNIFGINQLPQKNRKESCNIFAKNAYEQMINLEKKLEKKLGQQKNNGNLTNIQIKKKLNITIDHIINLGVTPSQLFIREHPKFEWNTKEFINTDKKKGKKTNPNENTENDFDTENVDIESCISNILNPSKMIYTFMRETLFFKIDETISKILVFDIEDNLIVLDCKLFSVFNQNFSEICKHSSIVHSNILYSREESIYQIKYGFCSFYKQINYYLNYHTYYYDKINFMLDKEKIIEKVKNSDLDGIKIITCRHIDFSFKIHYLEKELIKDKNKKNKSKINIYSFICEDFVTSCGCISSNDFIIGLNNGKLIYFTLKEMDNKNKKKIEAKKEISIEKRIYIQGHIGKINTIEIDKKLGVIMTSGDDNYIFIRKIFDLELLLPIKIKSKYKILMMKISSYNFLYILCLNKIKKEKENKVIFGYTLSGMKFAKSKYGLYDNINFTNDGNIITMNDKKFIQVFYGSNLSKLTIVEDFEIYNIPKEVKNTNWFQYDFFMRGKNEEYKQILTLFGKEKDKKSKKEIDLIKIININNF